MKATFVKDLQGFTGTAKLYRLDGTVSFGDSEAADHVVVSATVAMYSGPETYIFPADAEGNVVSYGELDGSYRGALDHERAIHNAGWEVQR